MRKKLGTYIAGELWDKLDKAAKTYPGDKGEIVDAALLAFFELPTAKQKKALNRAHEMKMNQWPGR